MDLKTKIEKLAHQYFPEVVDIRRHIHQHPELSFEEYKTSEFVCGKLEEYGISYKKGFVKTGIVGTIKGKNPDKKIVALRADMDALPVDEQNEVSYKSVNSGVMHACGHDVHTSSLLGTARILNELRDEWEGTVLLIFQPGEEKLPGGAKLMMEEGALDNPRPDLIIGQHVMPLLEAGKVGFRPGMYMASTDEIYMTVKGSGGHAAMPHQLVDPVLIASHIIVALQQIVSRHANTLVPSVLSFGRVEAKGATNVIPNEVKIEGTFRTLNESWRINAHKKIVKMAQSIAEGMGGSCDVNIKGGYPFLVNDEETTNRSIEFARDILGDSNVVNLDIRMTAEDFAYFSQKYPSTFYRLGVMDKKGTKNSSLHTSTFDVDESALETGMKTMAWLAVSLLAD